MRTEFNESGKILSQSYKMAINLQRLILYWQMTLIIKSSFLYKQAWYIELDIEWIVAKKKEQ